MYATEPQTPTLVRVGVGTARIFDEHRGRGAWKHFCPTLRGRCWACPRALLLGRDLHPRQMNTPSQRTPGDFRPADVCQPIRTNRNLSLSTINPIHPGRIAQFPDVDASIPASSLVSSAVMCHRAGYAITAGIAYFVGTVSIQNTVLLGLVIGTVGGGGASSGLQSERHQSYSATGVLRVFPGIEPQVAGHRHSAHSMITLRHHRYLRTCNAHCFVETKPPRPP